MGLCIIIAIFIFFYWIFCSDGLINYIKSIDGHNKEIQEKIEFGMINHDLMFPRTYSESDFYSVYKGLRKFIWLNIFCNFCSVLVVFIISFVVSFAWEMEPYSYSFDIYALNDQNRIEGRINRSAFSASGYINEEMSYFFIRDGKHGQIMGHIPANMTYIQYDDDVKPHITVYKEKSNIPEWAKKTLFDFGKEMVDRYEIVAPNGSVVNTYDIDME